MKAEDFERLKAVCEKEVWEYVIDFDGYYSVSSLGRVRNNVRGTILSQSIDKDGYFQISLKNKGKVCVRKPHRLVAQAFIPNPDNKPQVNHKDGNKQNNKKSNLEWNTQSENMKHSYRVLGRKDSLKRGIHSDRNVKVLAYFKCLKIEFYNIKSCGNFFNTSTSTIHYYLNSGKKYKNFNLYRSNPTLMEK